MHPIVGCGDSLQLKVPHAVNLELEGQAGLQVAVDTILIKLQYINSKLLYTKIKLQYTNS